MYEGFNIWSFVLGLPLGLVFAGVIWYFSRRNGKKQRRYDERYISIQRQARSCSWFVTAAAILIGWAVVIITEGPGLMFFLFTALWIVHIVSYGIAAAVAERKN